MTIDLIAGMLLTNIFLIVFWYVGEYLIDAFDKEPIVRQADLTHQAPVAKVKMPQREAEILPQDESIATHDRVATLKSQVLNLISTFEYRRHSERAKEARDSALRNILDDLDEVKRIMNVMRQRL